MADFSGMGRLDDESWQFVLDYYSRQPALEENEEEKFMSEGFSIPLNAKDNCTGCEQNQYSSDTTYYCLQQQSSTDSSVVDQPVQLKANSPQNDLTISPTSVIPSAPSQAQLIFDQVEEQFEEWKKRERDIMYEQKGIARTVFNDNCSKVATKLQQPKCKSLSINCASRTNFKLLRNRTADENKTIKKIESCLSKRKQEVRCKFFEQHVKDLCEELEMKENRIKQLEKTCSKM